VPLPALARAVVRRDYDLARIAATTRILVDGYVIRRVRKLRSGRVISQVNEQIG
jgi:hypothetical protein